MTDELISRARAGDAVAFQKLTESHRRELHVHCYRMLGSFQDAEDTLQETLLAAWQGFEGFEGRASLRTWLYRIATNRCLNARRSASRRPAKAWDVPGVEPPEPTRLGEVPWLDPFPDSLLDERATDAPLGPEVRYMQTESISLAFVAALQVLPRRQLAVLILSDILGFEASEVASILDATVDSVNSALKRARQNLQQRMPSGADRPRPPAIGSPAEEAIVEAKFVSTYEKRGIWTLSSPLHADDNQSSCRRCSCLVAARIRGPRSRGALLRPALPRGSEVQPGADESQWSAGVRRVHALRFGRPQGPPSSAPSTKR